MQSTLGRTEAAEHTHVTGVFTTHYPEYQDRQKLCLQVFPVAAGDDGLFSFPPEICHGDVLGLWKRKWKLLWYIGVLLRL